MLDWRNEWVVRSAAIGLGVAALAGLAFVERLRRRRAKVEGARCQDGGGLPDDSH